MNNVVEEGWLVDPEPGVVSGRNVEPDVYNHDSAPLYVYNRSVRFRELCYRYIANHNYIARILHIFTSLEDLWTKDKNRYSVTRKYFLSQKLLCKQIAQYIGCRCSIKRPIHDRKRLQTQMEILARLFKDFLLIKKESSVCQLPYILDRNQKHTTFNLRQSCRWPAGRLPGTPFETRELLMTLAQQWHSSSE